MKSLLDTTYVDMMALSPQQLAQFPLTEVQTAKANFSSRSSFFSEEEVETINNKLKEAEVSLQAQ